MNRLSSLLVAISVLLIPAVARAQDAKAASVLAFDEAQRLVAEGKISEACPKFAESQRLDPQLGTLLHLADCLEQNGQTASAWASFRDAAELAEKKGDPRRELAEQRIQALVPKLSRLLIVVPAGAELQVARDGVVVGSALFGAPVPTDPGPHTITASAPGRQTWTGKVVIPADGSVTTVTIPELEKQVPTSPEASVAPTAPATTLTDGTPAPDAPEKEGGIAKRWPALAAGGVGVVGVVIGSIFGAKSMSKGNDAEAYCGEKTCTDPKGIALTDEAIAAGNVSTIGFVIGGVGLAAGAVLWFTLPTGEEAKAGASRALTVGFAPGSISLAGTF